MKTFRATFLFTAVALLTASFASAQSIEALRKRQSSLELELERIKVQISEIESKASSPSETEKKPVWFIKDFGISQVNSAGGVEPFFVFINP